MAGKNGVQREHRAGSQNAQQRGADATGDSCAACEPRPTTQYAQREMTEVAGYLCAGEVAQASIRQVPARADHPVERDQRLQVVQRERLPDERDGEEYS